MNTALIGIKRHGKMPLGPVLALQIKRQARELGFDLVGITTANPPLHADQYQQWLANGCHGEMDYLARNVDKRIAPQKILPDARSIVVVGMNYNVEAVVPSGGVAHSAAGTAATTPAGRIARYARGTRDYHDLLGDKLQQLSASIEALGGQAKWCVDTGHVLERSFAQQAGIGFIGKHTNLINRSLGNWLFLGEVLTNLELPADPPECLHCGTCRRCLDACPTGALVAPYQLDARRCVSYLTIELKGSIPVELRSVIGDRVFGCDDCLEVCPWNRFARQSSVREFCRRELPLLVEFLSWDETKFHEFFHDTPIHRIKRRGFLRNVCVALGNTGDASALPALESARLDPEPLVREHASWAVEQIHNRQENRPLC
ncbi:MAG: tRNA epoxyqueuosine(34) reductase QueG [Verrucomicrobiia bacterium]